MEEQINKSEILYRAVKRSKPNWLESGKPSSAMFKDDRGVSVDRDGGRQLHEVIEFMEKGIFKDRLKGLVCLKAYECTSEPINAFLCPDTSEKNPFHALIFANEKKEGLSSIQALQLADLCEIVYYNEDMAWVNA